MYPETPGFSTINISFVPFSGPLAIRVIAGLRCPPEAVPVLAPRRLELGTHANGKARRIPVRRR